MGAYYETIPKSLIDWILAQKVFWVATAPLSNAGHVNVSPKGGDCFGLLDDHTFWYLDMTGSGNETISHLHEPGNGRITVMFNAFEGSPKIVRLWGKGRVLESGTKEFDEFVERQSVATKFGVRSIIVVDIHQVGSSCGFSVPLFEFKEHREILDNYFAKKHEKFQAGNENESMERYWAFKNAWSMDNLPGMKKGLETGKAKMVAPIKKMVGPSAPVGYKSTSSLTVFTAWQVFPIAAVSFALGLGLAACSPQYLQGLVLSN